MSLLAGCEMPRSIAGMPAMLPANRTVVSA
jgi:hypothetical protein